MRDGSRFDVAIIGGGVGGAAAAYELSKDPRLTICLLYRRSREGSSFTNQKWKHSGLLFENEELARFLWDAHRLTRGTLYDDFILGERRAHFLAMDDSLAKKHQLWKQWGISTWGLDVETGPACSTDCSAFLRNGYEACQTPDCAIDYPALVSRLLNEADTNGVQIISGAEFQRLQIDAGRVSGIWFSWAGQTHFMKCRSCVLASGVRTKAILEQMGLRTRLSVVQSTIVRVEGEIVKNVTVFLGSAADPPALNLVPFRGSTLISDISARPVEDLDDRSPDPAAAAAMLAAVSHVFQMKELPKHEAYGCHKVRISGDSLGDYPFVTQDPADGFPIKGLLAVDPLKASLMYSFGLKVRDAVLRTLF